MFKFIKKIILFFSYCKAINKHENKLSSVYGLNINLWYEMWTTITLVDAPDEIKKLGKGFVEVELKKYISTFNADLVNLDLNELVNVYEIKRIDNENYGITFGYALFNNKLLIISGIVLLIAIITIPLIIIL